MGASKTKKGFDYIAWTPGALIGTSVVALDDAAALASARAKLGKRALVQRLKGSSEGKTTWPGTAEGDALLDGKAASSSVSSPAKRVARGPRVAASAPSDLIAWVKSKDAAQYVKPVHLIRATAARFPLASVSQIRAALPELNPGTVGIQVGRVRRGLTKE